MEANAPAIPKNRIFENSMSQADSGVESNLVAANAVVIAVITSTTTIRGFDTSMKSLIFTAIILNLLSFNLIVDRRMTVPVINLKFENLEIRN